MAVALNGLIFSISITFLGYQGFFKIVLNNFHNNSNNGEEAYIHHIGTFFYLHLCRK